MQRKLKSKLLLAFICILLHPLLWAQVSSVQSSIDAACPCNGPVSGGQWADHSEYVSCVTAKVNQLSKSGVIPKNQKSVYITPAAQSDCGKGETVITDPTKDEDSPGILSYTGANEKMFNPLNVNLTFTVSNETFSSNVNDFLVTLNDVIVHPTYNLAANTVSFNLTLQDGLNIIDFLGVDAQGLALEQRLKLWAGSGTLSLRVINESGDLVNNANVKVNLGDDPTVFAAGVAANGLISFQNLPFRTLIESATAAGNLYGSTATVGGGSNVNLKLYGINVPSPVANKDFSQGTSGWVIGSAPVQIIEHAEGLPLQKIINHIPGINATQAITNPDLQVTTAGIGAQHVSHTFISTAGTKNITVRFRFITSEIPGGYYGSQYNDMYSIVIRSSMGSTNENKAMNELGLGAFDYASGATNWREISLPVNIDGDVIHVDVSVSNVGDGAYDSKVVVDYIGEKKLAFSDAVFFDPDKTNLLSYLSIDNHSYFGGKVPIYGALALKGAATDRLTSITLDVLKGNVVLASVPLAAESQADLYQVFGSDETVQMNLKKLVFEIPSLSPQLADGNVQLRINAETEQGEKVSYNYGSFPNLKLYQQTSTTYRYGQRDDIEGGDGWGLPSTIDFVASLASGWLVGDISNMNGNKFPPHSSHRDGFDIDMYFPGYENRNATVASTLINFLNSPQGARVGVVYVTYGISATDLFYNAIKDVTLANNKKATDVIRSIANHTSHFHVRVNPPAASSKLQSPVIRPERKQPATEPVTKLNMYNVFPNPADQAVYVISNVKEQFIEEIRMYNSAGVLVKQHKPGLLKTVTLNTNKLQSGAYIIEITGGGKTERTTIIVTH